MTRGSALGTSESFMHHPASDRYWPEGEVNLGFLNGSYWESSRSEIKHQGLFGAHTGSTAPQPGRLRESLSILGTIRKIGC